MATEADWRFGLNVGDEVIVLKTGSRVLGSVTRVTPSQVCVGGRTRFMRATGREVDAANSFYPCFIEQPTPGVVAKIKEAQERNRLYEQIVNLPHWTPTGTMRAMVALLDEAKAAREVAEGGGTGE